MIIIHFLALYAWLVVSTVDKKEVPTCAYITSAAFPLHLLFNSKEMEMQKVDSNYSISHLDQQLNAKSKPDSNDYVLPVFPVSLPWEFYQQVTCFKIA